MKTSHKLATMLAVTAWIAVAPKDAHALGPIGIEAGGKIGMATSPGGGTNPLGLGVGGRAGVTLFNIYLGFNIVDYLGSSNNVPGLSNSASALQYGGELGYGIKLIDIITIRPQVGLGNMAFSQSTTVGPLTASLNPSSFYVEPGVTGLVTLGWFFFGADINALIIPNYPGGASSNGSGGTTVSSSSTAAAFTLHGQLGVSF
jgi:hypothetical protein